MQETILVLQYYPAMDKFGSLFLDIEHEKIMLVSQYYTTMDKLRCIFLAIKSIMDVLLFDMARKQ